MVSNFLRIIFQKVLYHSAMKALEKQDKILRERATLEKAGQDEISYCIRPLMARHYELTLPMLEKCLKLLAIGMTIFAIAGVGYVWYVDGKVRINIVLEIIGCVLMVWCLGGLIRHALKYVEHTKYVFCSDKICSCVKI